MVLSIGFGSFSGASDERMTHPMTHAMTQRRRLPVLVHSGFSSGRLWDISTLTVYNKSMFPHCTSLRSTRCPVLQCVLSLIDALAVTLTLYASFALIVVSLLIFATPLCICFRHS